MADFGQTQTQQQMMATQSLVQESSAAQQPPASEADQIEFVVEQLNHILGRNFSLVEFDEMPPLQRLQVLSDLFGMLSPQARVDFGQLPVEAGCQTLIVFLTRTLQYRVPPMVQHSFFADFIAGEQSIIIPVLYWVLKRMPENRKRVYLAKYLSPLDVPEDLKQQDDGIRELCQRFEQLRGDFKQVHRRVDQLREASADPAEARRKIQKLEDERDQLHHSITTAQRKLSSVENRDALVNACKSLRAEQEEETKLRSKYDEQQRALGEAQRKSRDAANRLQAVKRDIADNRLDAVIQRMTDDLHSSRLMLDQTLPAELNERRVKVAALARLENEPVDVSALTSELNQLERECSQLSEEVARRNAPMQDGTSLVVAKDHTKRVVEKKKALVTELQTLQEKNNTLVQLVQEKQQQLDTVRGSKMLKGEDFKRYSSQVRSKNAAAANMKRRLADLRGEFGVLQYTEKLLKEHHEELQGDLSELEEKLGARGYVQRAEELSRVGEEKAQVEQVKAQTLEELSAVVQNINKAIHQHREQLAPKIVELRNQRNSAQVIEQEWEEKRSAYEYQQGMLMQEINKLETEVAGLSEEMRMNESAYHRINAQLRTLKAHQKRVNDEKEFRDGVRTLDVTARTYTQLFHQSTERLEQRNKEMQKRRRDIEENHETRLQQVEYFNALRKLLEAKLHSLSHESQSGQPGVGFEREIQGMMLNSTSTAAGVNRLVLGNED